VGHEAGLHVVTKEIAILASNQNSVAHPLAVHCNGYGLFLTYVLHIEKLHPTV
jgi:hypothetical protein